MIIFLLHFVTVVTNFLHFNFFFSLMTLQFLFTREILKKSINTLQKQTQNFYSRMKLILVHVNKYLRLALFFILMVFSFTFHHGVWRSWKKVK